ncbi:MAG: hypothetical protein HY052_01855, partial [Proteobacteria bacterium]|nr:hypothetical protein [Pseudomonadota bacterium]
MVCRYSRLILPIVLACLIGVSGSRPSQAVPATDDTSQKPAASTMPLLPDVAPVTPPKDKA